MGLRQILKKFAAGAPISATAQPWQKWATSLPNNCDQCTAIICASQNQSRPEMSPCAKQSSARKNSDSSPVAIEVAPRHGLRLRSLVLLFCRHKPP